MVSVTEAGGSTLELKQNLDCKMDTGVIATLEGPQSLSIAVLPMVTYSVLDSSATSGMGGTSVHCMTLSENRNVVFGLESPSRALLEPTKGWVKKDWESLRRCVKASAPSRIEDVGHLADPLPEPKDPSSALGYTEEPDHASVSACSLHEFDCSPTALDFVEIMSHYPPGSATASCMELPLSPSQMGLLDTKEALDDFHKLCSCPKESGRTVVPVESADGVSPVPVPEVTLGSLRLSAPSEAGPKVPEQTFDHRGLDTVVNIKGSCIAFSGRPSGSNRTLFITESLDCSGGSSGDDDSEATIAGGWWSEARGELGGDGLCGGQGGLDRLVGSNSTSESSCEAEEDVSNPSRYFLIFLPYLLYKYFQL